jgi:hypothetical protein
MRFPFAGRAIRSEPDCCRTGIGVTGRRSWIAVRCMPGHRLYALFHLVALRGLRHGAAPSPWPREPTSRSSRTSSATPSSPRPPTPTPACCRKPPAPPPSTPPHSCSPPASLPAGDRPQGAHTGDFRQGHERTTASAATPPDRTASPPCCGRRRDIRLTRAAKIVDQNVQRRVHNDPRCSGQASDEPESAGATGGGANRCSVCAIFLRTVAPDDIKTGDRRKDSPVEDDMPLLPRPVRLHRARAQGHQASRCAAACPAADPGRGHSRRRAARPDRGAGPRGT